MKEAHMPEGKRELADIDVYEVSLVDSPAIRRKFLVLKSEEREDMDDEVQFSEELAKALTQEAANAIKGALNILGKYMKDMPREAQDAINSLNNTLRGSGYGYAAPKKEELPPEVAKQLEAIVKEAQTKDEVIKSLKAEVVELRKASWRKEMEPLAKAMFGKPEENLALLEKMHDSLSPEDFQAFVERERAIIRHTEEAGLYQEAGKSTPGPVESQSKVEAMAKALVEKGQAKSIPEATA
jgi:hypothetical protein